MRARQSGIALVQVLFLTAILLLLVTQLSLMARDQVHRAQALLDRSTAVLAIHSREAALLFTLLTEPMVVDPESENPYVAAWNFHGAPFEVDGLRLRLQDQSALMQVPIGSTGHFEQVLEGMGAEPGQARRIGAELMAWQGRVSAHEHLVADARMRAGRGGVVQYFGELRHLESMDDTLLERLAKVMTLYPSPVFNPLNAPPELLVPLLPASAIRDVISFRTEGDLDALTLWRATGLDPDESIAPLTGPGMAIELEARFGATEASRRTVVGLQPYVEPPLLFWSRQRFDTGVPR